MKKIITALVLFIAAGAIAFFLKDWIDRTNPDYAIPQMTVTADSNTVNSTVSGYSWKFNFGDTVIKEEILVIDISMDRNLLLGGEDISVSFSQPPLETKIRRSESYSYDFFETGDLTVPYESGGYIYEVLAHFEDGTVLYYFYIVVE